MIEDIKGYKPHTEEKIGKVNAIKDAEVRLGLILKALEDEYIEIYSTLGGNEEVSDSKLDEAMNSIDCIQKAKSKLKEASMWACRAVFQPEEKY
ncbi:hypothetical protein RB68_122 [Enterobacteria phage RB68]|uniref:Uncharacterized protein vs.4 n=1 Tax=Enterobacteria phage RB51 TaxID=10693 RepID=C3V2A8_BPR51|nr:vs.4 hypothetical protein [Enterobacteria phage RB51]YP_009167491.1 hypothetical protein RB68_122 [Enterobacteria phage RB68]ACP31040.1 vs.4 hypothetical protein [Enterobacteria phage RB51]AIT75582.1 hypothetical protein RB68_122 [Enterobacteria phage RB68]UJJ74505.1 hypothetical protein CPTAc3_124 [Enterobacteria phage Ac3]